MNTLADSFVEIIQNVEEAENRNGLSVQLEHVMLTYGFDALAYYVVKRNFRVLSTADGERINSSPGLARKLFRPDQAITFDPIVAEAVSRLEPFHWFDGETHPEISEQQRQIFRHLREDGFEDGLTVPVASQPGDVAVFNFSKRGTLFPLANIELQLLGFVCQTIHKRFEALHVDEPKPDLSPREKEVMSLVALGLSNGEIANKLSVSSHTIDTLMRRSFLKLGVNNRIQATISLVLSGAVVASL